MITAGGASIGRCLLNCALGTATESHADRQVGALHFRTVKAVSDVGAATPGQRCRMPGGQPNVGRYRPEKHTGGLVKIFSGPGPYHGGNKNARGFEAACSHSYGDVYDRRISNARSGKSKSQTSGSAELHMRHHGTV